MTTKKATGTAAKGRGKKKAVESDEDEDDLDDDLDDDDDVPVTKTKVGTGKKTNRAAVLRFALSSIIDLFNNSLFHSTKPTCNDKESCSCKESSIKEQSQDCSTDGDTNATNICPFWEVFPCSCYSGTTENGGE